MERKRETIDVLNIPNFADSVCKIETLSVTSGLLIPTVLLVLENDQIVFYFKSISSIK